MATKKQKRAAGEAKQALNREESRRLGLLAQEKAAKREAAERQKRREAAEKENARLNEILKRGRASEAIKKAAPKTV